MISAFQAIVLGIIQGATEFLPISSSAHLFIVPWIFNWQYQGLAFDVVLHLGTLVGVVAYLWGDWKRILRGALTGERERTTFWFIILACLPGALVGALLEKEAERIFRAPLLIAISSSSFAIVLWATDFWGKQRKNIEEMTFLDALLIGVAQAIAIIPGVSRSGATMSMGLAVGLKKEATARFSFLLSTPIILGAALWEGRKILHIASSEILPLMGGFFASALSGYLAVWFLLKYLKKGNFLPFVWYRLLFALLIVAVIIIRL